MFSEAYPVAPKLKYLVEIDDFIVLSEKSSISTMS